MIIQWRPFIAALIMSLSLLTGCGSSSSSQGCDDIACLDRLAISVHNDGWATGLYQLDVEFAGKNHVCTLSVGTDSVASCSSDRLRLHIGDFSFGNITLELLEAPDEVRLRVTFEGTLLLTQILTPNYRETTIGSGECRMSCRNADATVAFKQ
jgi:hypothetical protein